MNKKQTRSARRVCFADSLFLKNMVDYGILYKIADYRYQEYEINFILRAKDFKRETREETIE